MKHHSSAHLDGEVDEVGVDEYAVRGSESGVVREEHGRGHLLDVVRLRLFRLGRVNTTAPIAQPHEPTQRDQPTQSKEPSERTPPERGRSQWGPL